MRKSRLREVRELAQVAVLESEPPLSDPRSACLTGRPRDFRRLSSARPSRRKIVALLLLGHGSSNGCPGRLIHPNGPGSYLQGTHSMRSFRETVFMEFRLLGEVSPLHNQRQGQHLPTDCQPLQKHAPAAAPLWQCLSHLSRHTSAHPLCR